MLQKQCVDSMQGGQHSEVDAGSWEDARSREDLGLGKMLAPGKMLGLGKMLRPSGTTTVIEYCEGPWSRFFLFAPTKKLHYSL
jgi:hypothetical protein